MTAAAAEVAAVHLVQEFIRALFALLLKCFDGTHCHISIRVAELHLRQSFICALFTCPLASGVAADVAAVHLAQGFICALFAFFASSPRLEEVALSAGLAD